DENFTVVLSNPTNATVADDTGVGTIVNDDAGNGTLSIADASVVEGNAGTTPENLVVTLSPAQPIPVTVNFTTVDGTATVADNDYLPLSGTLVFGPGETTQVVSVSVVGDLQVEIDETYTVVLSNPVGATIADGTGVGTIVNDDAGNGTLSIADASVVEGNAGTTPENLVVTLSPAQPIPVTVNFTTVDGTATVADNDYLPLSGTLVFGPGETTQVVSVSVVGDLQVELDETYTVVLSNPVNATIADGTGVGTIVNDDVAGNGTLSIADASVVEGNTGTTPENLVVTLSPPQAVPVTVSFTTVDGTATVSDNDYLPLSGTLVFGPGETTQVVSVSVVGDLQVELDETYTVVLSNPVGATIADGTGVGTIVNDDAAGNGTLSI